VRVKICGVRQPADSLVAARAGADFVGLVFVPGRRRRLGREDAGRVVAALRGGIAAAPRVVGLFADQPAEEVCRTVERCSLDMVQLCGDESPEYCDQLGVPVIKVVHVPAGGEMEAALERLSRRAEAYVLRGHMITLDRKVVGMQGGTGRSFDWSIARAMAARGFSFLLAGGLTPENVGLALRTVRPWGVDVSSGVETGGAKDPDKIRAFVQAAKAAHTSA
jgi:phosphoribosylanthranilate isomerase